MKEKGMKQRCKVDKVIVDGNWEDYMWPHPIDKTPRLDQEVLSFLHKLNLSELTGIFDNQKVHSMEIVMSLNEEHLKDIGIKLGDRIIILKETHGVLTFRTQVMSPPNEKINGSFIVRYHRARIR